MIIRLLDYLINSLIILRDRITQFIVLAWLLSFLILIYIV